MARTIPLYKAPRKGVRATEIVGEAIVDDADYERIVALGPWRTNVRTWKGRVIKTYVVRGTAPKTEYLHRVIMGVGPGDLSVDHINGDTLDNRRSNLRICTHQENRRNTRTPSTNVSGYKGVCFIKRFQKWEAWIVLNGQGKYVKRCNTAEDAARAYDDAARLHYGAFARLNFPRDGEQGVR